MTIAAGSRLPTTLFDAVAEHNPFYLLSAACMLAGCLALTNTLTFSPVPLSRLAPLIVTLNIYELALIGLALYLVRARGLVRDGWVLLALQAMFLVDITFLNSEIVTLSLGWGLAANIIVFMLALVKLALVLRVLEVRLPWHKVAFIVLQLLVLFSLPVAFKMMDRAAVSPARFYAAWWIVGLLPAVYELLVRVPWGRRVQSVAPAAQAAPTSLYLGLPYASLLLHLGMLHFVYDTTFHGAHAAPVLLGLALVLNRIPVSSMATPGELVVMRVLLPAAAILVSLNNPEALVFGVGGFEITPRMLGFVGAYLVYVYCFLLPWALPMLAAGAVVGLGWMYGPSASDVAAYGRTAYGWVVSILKGVIPRTSTAWGVVGVVAAFVFLGIGAAISLRKRPPGEVAELADAVRGEADDA